MCIEFALSILQYMIQGRDIDSKKITIRNKYPNERAVVTYVDLLEFRPHGCHSVLTRQFDQLY